MANIQLDEIIAKSFFNLFETFMDTAAKEMQTFKDELEAIFGKTRYDKLGQAINELLGTYNSMIVEDLRPKLVRVWEESESSFQAFLMTLEAGEQAERYAKWIDTEINDMLNRGFKPFNLITIKNIEAPEATEDIFFEVQNAFKLYSEKMETLKNDFEQTVMQLTNENQLFKALIPLSNGLALTVIYFIDEASKVFDNLHKDYVSRLSRNREAAANAASEAAASRDGLSELNKDGAAVFSSLGVSNPMKGRIQDAISKGSAPSKKTYPKLKEFAVRLFKQKENTNVMVDFSKYLYDTIEAPEQTEIPLPIFSKMMSIYELYFTAMGGHLLLRKEWRDNRAEWETYANNTYKHIVLGENDPFFASDEDRWAYRSHWANLSVYHTVARMVKKTCEENAYGPRFRSFFVLYNIIAYASGVDQDYKDEYAAFSLAASAMLFTIIGEKPMLGLNEKSIKNTQQTPAADSRVERQLEAYLQTHHKNMEELHKKYGDKVDQLLDALQSIQTGKTPQKKLDLLTAEQTKYSVSQSLVDKMSAYSHHVKSVRKLITERLKEKGENVKENLVTLLDLLGGVLSIVGAFSPTLMAFTIVGKAVQADKVITGAASILKSPKIMRWLLRGVGKSVKGYEGCGEAYIIKYTVEAHKKQMMDPIFPPLSEMVSKETNVELKEKIENAFLAAWKYINDDENYKILGNDPNNPVFQEKWRKLFTGTFLKLVKAGLLCQDVNQSDSDGIIDRLYPILSKAFGVTPDLNIDPEQKHVNIQ